MQTAMSRFRSAGTSHWREMVARTTHAAIEAAENDQFYTASWWGKNLIGREIDRFNADLKFVWVDGIESKDGQEAGGPNVWDSFVSTAARQENIAFVKQLMNSISRLPIKQRQAIQLRMCGADVFEISRKMLIAPGDVVHLLREARQWLDRV